MSETTKAESAGTEIVEAKYTVASPPVTVTHVIAVGAAIVTARSKFIALDPSTLQATILLIFKIYSDAVVTRLAKLSVKFQPNEPPSIVATDTIFGFAIINSFYCYYPKIIAIAIAFPVEIPAVAKLRVPEPSVTKASSAFPSAEGNT